MAQRVLVFDPGDSTGWVFKDLKGNIIGGTFYKSFKSLESLFSALHPDVVVFETFKLYAGAAKHLIHDEFYTVQVIGAIKLLCEQYKVKSIVPQGASVKRYSGGLDARWKTILKDGGITEHIKDAYLHLRFYERFGEEKSPK